MQASLLPTHILNWSATHGRQDLPWQQSITPYRVWVSEIMLQQTRVDTVVPYFERFMKRFPKIEDLAEASLDTVLAHWSGLGYYARARNLHKTATLITSTGFFPDTLESLCKLPGIGRSTAGAILSIAFQKSTAILDGNVKRVLARFYGIEGWPGDPRVNRELWYRSERQTPKTLSREYTQAIMDLGATVCTRRKPECAQCPLNFGCFAFLHQQTDVLPSPQRRNKMPVKSCTMLLLRNNNGLCYLEKRPPTGIWGGLWGLPEFCSKSDTVEWCAKTGAANLQWLPQQRHTFSHYHLDYTPVVAQWLNRTDCVREDECGLWSDPSNTNHLGLPTPIKKLLDRLRSNGLYSQPEQRNKREEQ